MDQLVLSFWNDRQLLLLKMTTVCQHLLEKSFEITYFTNINWGKYCYLDIFNLEYCKQLHNYHLSEAKCSTIVKANPLT